jgi:hypothetical protein
VTPFKSLLRGVISETRPMDNMALTLDVPQEDELATNVRALGCNVEYRRAEVPSAHAAPFAQALTGGLTAYMPLVFMTEEPEFRQYFDYLHTSAADSARSGGAGLRSRVCVLGHPPRHEDAWAGPQLHKGAAAFLQEGDLCRRRAPQARGKEPDPYRQSTGAGRCGWRREEGEERVRWKLC